jgi:hypothetical protein
MPDPTGYTAWNDVAAVESLETTDTLLLSGSKRATLEVLFNQTLTRATAVTVFDDAAARDAAWTTPADGWICYVAADAALCIYRDGGWDVCEFRRNA